MTQARDPKHTTLREVVTAQVTLLWSRFRPMKDMGEEERKALAAERQEWGRALTSYLRAQDEADGAVIAALRTVCREILQQQGLGTVPSPEEVSTRVRRLIQKPLPTVECLGCKMMGGTFRAPHGVRCPPTVGLVPWGDFSLCLPHHEVLNWYAWRAERVQHGMEWNQPPPASLVGWSLRPPASEWASLTDGERMGEMARWAHALIAERFPEWTLTPRTDPYARNPEEV